MHTPTVILFTDGSEVFTCRMLPQNQTVEDLQRDCAERCGGELGIVAIEADKIISAVNSHAALVSALQDIIKAFPVGELSVRKDFSKMNALAGASKVLHSLNQN